MLSSYRVHCPNGTCQWIGNLIPSRVPGGSDSEATTKQTGWFHCPRCQHDWQVRIVHDDVALMTAAAAAESAR
jgi:hypothetical protein